MESLAPNIKIIDGDLLEFVDNYYICHQCNCKTKTAKGLSQAIFKKFPIANTYISNEERIPGRIEIFDRVINLYGQYFPGGPRGKNDSSAKRLSFFKSGLNQIDEQIEKDENVAFPYNIGCGLAKGNWSDYLDLIDYFAKKSLKRNILIVKKI